MKKTKSLLLLCFAIIIALSLFSCAEVTNDEDLSDEPLTADKLFDKIDKKMDSYDSYEAIITAQIKATVNGYEVNGTIEGSEIRVGLVDGEYGFYSETVSVISAPSLALNQTTNSVNGYYNGNYFISNSGEGTNRNLYSPMTKEEAIAYQGDGKEFDFFTLKDATNKEFVKNEDESYKLTFSGYASESINELVSVFKFDELYDPEQIVDVTFIIIADSHFNATELSVTLEFQDAEGAEKTPEMSIKATYSKYNEAVIDESKIDLSKYTKMDDIRLIDTIIELMDGVAEKSEGEFSLAVSQTVKIMGETQTSKETDKIVFGTGNSGFYYEIDADTNGAKYDISYENGQQTVKQNGQSSSNAQSEEAAREFIKSLLNSCQFNEGTLTNVVKVSDKEYKITCVPKTLYEQVFNTMGATYKSVEQTITLTLNDNGGVAKIYSTVNAKGTLTQGNSSFEMTMNIESQVDITK